MRDGTPGAACCGETSLIHEAQPRGASWLFVLPWDLHHVGGVNQVVMNLAHEMGRGGRLTPLVGINKWRQRTVAGRAHEGIPVIRFWVPSPWTERAPWRNLARYVLTLPFTLLRLRQMLRRHGVRVVNVHYPGSSAVTWVLLRRLGLFDGRVVLSLHGLDVRSQRDARGLPRLLWRYALNRADQVVACSDGLREETLALFDLDGHNMSTIHNGIDESTLLARIGETRSAPLPTSRRYLINIGTYEHKKGHDTLLEAFADVARRHADVDLVVIGRDGETYPGLVRRSEQPDLAGRVHLFRDLHHSLTLHILAHAEFFVLPSRDEGFAVVLLEAAAFGKPIIATDVCGVAELIEDRATGRIVQPDEPAALAEAMHEYLEDVAGSRGMGARLRAAVHALHPWQAKCAAYLALAHDGG